MRLLKIFLALTLLAPTAASAYSVAVHDRMADALIGLPETDQRVALPETAGLNRFREAFYAAAAAHPDAALRSRFVARYPDVKAFTAAAFKEFFGMSATHPALGFDDYAAVAATADPRDPRGAMAPGVERTVLEWVRIGAMYPDLDRRNRGRWYTEHGVIQTTPSDERIPFDPVVLNMGQIEPLSGQAHAHYGLNRNPKSDEPDVLKERPADFAVRIGFPEAPVMTFAPERAQAYGELAQFAKQMNEPALAALFAGNAFHYMGDLGNQIHTIQVGIYDFFVDATLQSWKTKFFTLWGLFGEPMERNQIGVDIIGNHHTWSEEIFRVAMQRAEAGRPLSPAITDSGSIYRGAADVPAAWQKLAAEPEGLRALSDALILEGNRAGPEIYALARKISANDLREAGVKFDFEKETDAVVVAHLEAGHDQDFARMLEIQAHGLKRAAAAQALWWRARYTAAPEPRDAVLARLLRRQLDELADAEARRAIWLRKN